MVPIEVARSRVIRAALRVLESDLEEVPHAHSDDEAAYANELLALASRDLVEVVNAGPPRDRPVGWDGQLAADPGEPA